MSRVRSVVVASTLFGVMVSACLPLARAPTPSPPSAASEAPSPTLIPAGPSSSPSSSPSASAVSTAGVHVKAVAALPADPYFFSLGGPDNSRIMLFDSSATRSPVEVVTFDPTPAPSSGQDVRAIAFGASADGRVLVIARRFSERRTVQYLVRPQTGEVVGLLTDLAASFSEPVVSPDGSRYAYARLGDANGTGIYVADARPGPDPKRLVGSDPSIVGSPPQPVAWSPDGAWLALTISDTGGSRLGVVRVQAGETMLDIGSGRFTGGDARLLGPGHAIDWRGGDQDLLVTSSRHAFGGRSFVYATTIDGGPLRELYVPSAESVLSDARWHPALDRFFVYETPLCCGANRPSTIWIRKPDGSGTKLVQAVLGAPWWSKDGTRLWAQTLGDDSVSAFRDLLSTTSVMFCLRSPTPPCA